MKKITQLLGVILLPYVFVSHITTVAESTENSNTFETTYTERETSNDASSNTNTNSNYSLIQSTDNYNSIDSNNSTVSTTTDESTDNSMKESTALAIEGDGKKDTPFLINTFEEMRTVSVTISSSTYYNSINTGTVYIKLMNSITSTGSGANFSGNPNPIIIDGANTSEINGRFSIYYTGGTTTSGGLFQLGSRDLNITFSNINFGSRELSKSTYYGICYSTSVNNIININNVNYYAETGGQPFFITGNNSTLNFYGNNSFVVSSNGPQNQEFAEFAGTMNFKSDSKTSIVQKTGESLAFIWSYTPIQINVEEKAQLFIQSGKTDFFYPNKESNLNISKKANFTYFFDNNLSYIDPNTVFMEDDDYKTIERTGTSNASSNNFFNGNTNFNIEIKKDAYLSFLTATYPFQTGTVNINTIDPMEIKFKHTDPNKFALNDGGYAPTLNISNHSEINSIYNFTKNSLGDSQFKTNELVLPNKSITPMINGFKAYNSLVYLPAVKVGGLTALGYSAPNTSKIDSHLTGIYSNLDNTFTYQAQYYISNNTDILDEETVTLNYNNMNKNETPTNSSTHYDGSVYKPIMSLPAISNNEGDQSTLVSLDQLLGGLYKVYGRLLITSEAGNYYTPWQCTDATINSYSSVTFPTKIDINSSFTYQRKNGVLGLYFDKSPLYTISNSSNQIMNVKPMTLDEGSKNQVDLVSGNVGNDNDRKLQLNLISNTSLFNWNLGYLDESNVLKLQPYWDNMNNKKQFYLDGSYSGPFLTTSKSDVEYNLMLLLFSN
ncbi:hypothetical protein NG844_01805 [Enterococcus faecalis]|uniref:hypothetical protein n=1 Tax=Enterococcus faecalis TaxID=1351 RepID=UPI00209074A1|nr:hypothetical protein [Enterococcus faecalis]MCO5446156.1 hypothetical protein [Enterococcus faecalis]